MGVPAPWPAPPLIVRMSFRLVFLGGLFSSSARLRFASRYPVCVTVVLPVEEIAANGQHCRNWWSQLRGQA